MIRKFLYKEDGQTLGLFALVTLVLIVVAFFIYNVGDFFIFCIREQNAVDAAALSGAAVQANALNKIVKLNRKPIPQLYLTYIWLCRICCLCCGPHCGCCCSICPTMGSLMRVTEFGWRLLLWSKLIQADLSSYKAVRDAYRNSGGKGSIIPTIIPLTLLKIVEIKERVPKVRGRSSTFCGVAEKKRNRKYDWAGGKHQDPDIKGSYKGYYDKKGPFVLCSVVVEYKPVTSWFPFSKKLFFKAAARPYGGNVHPKRWRYGLRGWGKATFTAKLVPVKSLY